MKFLLTNDDGVYSVGIQTMAKHLNSAGHEVLLVAPDRERSATGHAMTLDRPVHIRKVAPQFLSADFDAYACDGTPTDCVIMGIDALEFIPDMVISGINQGPNLADDITYSGTACAAMEGLIFEKPSIAVSLVMSSKDKKLHNDTAAQSVMALIESLKEDPMPEGVLYNVNVPNLPMSEIKGFSLTKKGVRRYIDKISSVKSPGGAEAYWIGGQIVDELIEGTDVWAISNSKISVTPIHLEMTSFDTYRKFKDGCVEDKLNAYLNIDM